MTSMRDATSGVQMSFDYVIVGSGAAGSVLAERLSRNLGSTVLVLEAGGSDNHPIHRVPKGLYFTMQDPRYTKAMTTQGFGEETSVEQWRRGRVVGGSTTINGMIWNRGWAPGYAAWDETSNPAWSWESFLRAFTLLEDHELGGNAIRGQGGPVPISLAGPRQEVSDAFIASLEAQDVAFVDDLNGSGQDRVAYCPQNVKRGFRVSAARSFLHPSMRRPNLRLMADAEVERLVLDGSVVTGVEAMRKGKRVRVQARREVLVCAGALESPLLLERSGIGDPDILTAAGVPVVAANANVGEGLVEHRCLRFLLRLKEGRGYNAQINSTIRRGWSGLKYLITREGIMSFGGYDVIANYRSDPASPHPDTQGYFTPVSASSANSTSGRMSVDQHAGAMFLTQLLYPSSRGSIHVTGPHPDDPPTIFPGYLVDPHDRELTYKMFLRAREILATMPLSTLIEEETVPGAMIPEGASPDAVIAYVLKHGVHGYHTVGTCTMGDSPASVVDNRLRVRGVKRLRVVDASVFPEMPSGNNNAPTQAMAWIAADLIEQDAVGAS